MIFFYGTRNIRIRKYEDYHIKCDSCNDFGQKFSVYRKYFHVFFIPLFPIGAKTIKLACLKCNDTFNEEKKNHYLAITKTPIYLYTGIILFVGLIIAIVIGNINAQKQKAEYVANPKINDVYLIRQEEDKSRIYYFLKIKNIDSDTVELLHSNLQYSGFTSTMNDSDYFVQDEIQKMLNSELINYLEIGIINSVERDYNKSSRFMIEK